MHRYHIGISVFPQVYAITTDGALGERAKVRRSHHRNFIAMWRRKYGWVLWAWCVAHRYDLACRAYHQIGGSRREKGLQTGQPAADGIVDEDVQKQVEELEEENPQSTKARGSWLAEFITWSRSLHGHINGSGSQSLVLWRRLGVEVGPGRECPTNFYVQQIKFNGIFYILKRICENFIPLLAFLHDRHLQESVRDFEPGKKKKHSWTTLYRILAERHFNRELW